MAHKSVPGVSVIICTYNGGRNLPETLAHLSRQRVRPDLQWEILVIDNASTDDTPRVAAQAWAGLGSAVRFAVLQEPRAGKNNAVDRGLQQARYDYILICDDDNWLDEHYVQTALDVMSANARIGMLGGRGIPVFEAPPPAWFNRFGNYYAVGPQNPASGEVTTSKGFLWGAGAVINRQAYEKLLSAGFRRVITHENYPRISRGEDIELCLAIRLCGYKIWYDDRLCFHHYIAKSKLTWKYLTRLAKEGAAMGVMLQPYRRLLKNPALVKAWPDTWSRLLLRHVYSGISYRNCRYLVSNAAREGDVEALRSVTEWQHLLALLTFNRKVDAVAAQVRQLARQLQRPEPAPTWTTE